MKQNEMLMLFSFFYFCLFCSCNVIITEDTTYKPLCDYCHSTVFIQTTVWLLSQYGVYTNHCVITVTVRCLYKPLCDYCHSTVFIQTTVWLLSQCGAYTNHCVITVTVQCLYKPLCDYCHSTVFNCNYKKTVFTEMTKKSLEITKVVIRSHKSKKDRSYNGQKIKEWSIKHYTKN